MFRAWGFHKTTKRGQSILEYAILSSVLCLVVVTMTVYVRNGVNAKLYVVQKRLNEAGVNRSFPRAMPSSQGSWVGVMGRGGWHPAEADAGS